MHSLEESHHVFVNLNDCKIYCLPDNYEVLDASLNDIKYNLMAMFTEELVKKLDSEPLFARGLDGTEFYPGCLGLNNLRETDYVNVVI
jgi:U4/U6.U5 tri-snRNP-associated protein 2